MRLALCLVFAMACGTTGTIGGDDRPGDTPGDSDGDGQPDTLAACKRVDVVIAVDNSSSMSEEKDALREIAFPGFAAALKNVAGGLDDFRVGVLDACPAPANFHTRGLGGACNFQSGKSWIESSSTSLVDEFKCVGDIDSSDMQCQGNSDDEQSATAAATALEPAWLGAGKPNEGFLRDDALLVVVAITDEDEQPTPNASAQEVYDRLVAAKGGDIKKLVFLGIGGGSACDDGAYGSAEYATKLEAVTKLFAAQGRGVFWDICQGNLDQGLALALQTIESACEDFGPIL